jgi:hypothetical protein
LFDSGDDPIFFQNILPFFLLKATNSDHMGRIFASFGDFFLWEVFLEIIEVAKFVVDFFHGKSCVLLMLKKASWKSFWAIFSKTHLVTLVTKQPKFSHDQQQCIDSDAKMTNLEFFHGYDFRVNFIKGQGPDPDWKPVTKTDAQPKFFILVTPYTTHM